MESLIDPLSPIGGEGKGEGEFLFDLQINLRSIGFDIC